MTKETRTLFSTGDVMLGRGIDQALHTSVDPGLHEPHVKDARRYLELAEDAHGCIPVPLSASWVWGDALEELERIEPDATIVNLETAMTTSDDWHQGKGIHYRMHPDNVDVLTTAGIDVCVLANNHVLDWGRDGLEETCAVLDRAGISRCGAGSTLADARAPATVDTPRGRVLVHACGFAGSGIPRDWAATESSSGVNGYSQPDAAAADDVAERLEAVRSPGDLVVVSVHWGGNWRYEVTDGQRAFAHRLIDSGTADMIHGHSSHHPKGIEIYRGKLVLYGAGDFINDYEGIGGHEQYRPDLRLAYVTTFGPRGELASFEAVPFTMRRFRLERADSDDARWLADRLDQESAGMGARIQVTDDDRISVSGT